MEDLGGRHIAESEARGDVGQWTPLDSRVPERLAFAFGELLEYAVDEVSIGDSVLHVRPAAGIWAQRDEGLPQALPAP